MNRVYKMTAEEVAAIAMGSGADQPLFILDVRSEEAYRDGKIEGRSIRSVNIPYYELLDGVDAALSVIPDGHHVLVVCAKEGSSVYVAEQLAIAGLPKVSYLKGGMQTWSELLLPVKVADLSQEGGLYQFNRIGKGCLSYVVLVGDEAAIIDPARMTEPYMTFLRQHGARLVSVIDTHVHADHVSGGRSLARQSGATYYLPPADAAEVTYDYAKLLDGDSIFLGGEAIRIQPIYSPGHTIGSTSLLIDDRYLLSGDILFVQSIGRPDLAGQAEDWVQDLRHTLYARYRQLSEDLTVLPAHYAQMSELDKRGIVAARLGDMYLRNPGLRIKDEQQFRRLVTEQLPPQPHAYQEIRQTNMGRLNPTEQEQREMEIGPNRCAVHDHAG